MAMKKIYPTKVTKFKAVTALNSSIFLFVVFVRTLVTQSMLFHETTVYCLVTKTLTVDYCSIDSKCISCPQPIDDIDPFMTIINAHLLEKALILS